MLENIITALLTVLFTLIIKRLRKVKIRGVDLLSKSDEERILDAIKND